MDSKFGIQIYIYSHFTHARIIGHFVILLETWSQTSILDYQFTAGSTLPIITAAVSSSVLMIVNFNNIRVTPLS